MRLTLTLLATVLACGGALAQAPSGTVQRPAAQQNPNASGGMAQATGEMNADMRKMMDSNNDGMVSRQEWDAYHSRMWTSMKPTPQGSVPWVAVETAMRGTPK